MHLFKDNLTGTPVLSMIVRDRSQRRLHHKQMLNVLLGSLSFQQTSTWNHYLFSMQMCFKEDQRNTSSKGLDKLIKPHIWWKNWWKARYIRTCSETRNLSPTASNCKLIGTQSSTPGANSSQMCGITDTVNMTGTPVLSVPNSPNNFQELAWKITIYNLYVVKHKRNTRFYSNGYISLQKTHEAKALLTIKQLLPPSVKHMLL